MSARAINIVFAVWIIVAVIGLAGGLGTLFYAAVALNHDALNIGLGLIMTACLTGFAGGGLTVLWDRYQAAQVEPEPDE